MSLLSIHLPAISPFYSVELVPIVLLSDCGPFHPYVKGIACAGFSPRRTVAALTGSEATDSAEVSTAVLPGRTPNDEPRSSNNPNSPPTESLPPFTAFPSTRPKNSCYNFRSFCYPPEFLGALKKWPT